MNEWVKNFEYELALDSYIDFSKLKYQDYTKTWYYPVEEIVYRLNEVLGLHWSCRTSQPVINQIDKFLVVNVDLEINLNGKFIVRSSLSGKPLNAGKKDKTALGDLELITKGSASEALKKAASYFGVAYYIYNKDNCMFLNKIFRVTGNDIFLRENVLTEANKKLIESYDVIKMKELREMYIQSGKTNEDWNEYTKNVNFMNIKAFIFSHDPVIKPIMWKNIYKTKIRVE